jgi:predicted RND superfamily exporter protein
MWLCATQGLIHAKEQNNLTGFDYKVSVPMLGLYSGWLSVAVFLNTTSVFRKEIGTFGLDDTCFAYFTIVPAVVMTAYLLYAFRGYIWYAIPVLWALVAVAVNNYINFNVDIFYSASGAAGLMAIYVIALNARNKKPKVK